MSDESKAGDDVRPLSFETPPPGRSTETAEAPLKGGNLKTAPTADSTLLSPLLTERLAFAKAVIAICQRVVTGEDTAIDNAIGDFLAQQRINTEMALNLITEDDLPAGSPGSIWQNSLF